MYHVGGKSYESSTDARREAERLCRASGAGNTLRITDEAGEWAGEARSFIRGDGLLGSSSCVGMGAMAPVDADGRVPAISRTEAAVDRALRRAGLA